jgi:hypothetical protein
VWCDGRKREIHEIDEPKVEECRYGRPIIKEYPRDEACWRSQENFLKKIKEYKYFQGGRVEKGRRLVSSVGWCLQTLLW